MVAVFGIGAYLISTVIYETTPLPLYFIECNDITGGRDSTAKAVRALGWFESVIPLPWEKPGSGSWERRETGVLYTPGAPSLLTTQLEMKPGDRWWN